MEVLQNLFMCMKQHTKIDLNFSKYNKVNDFIKPEQ